MALKIIRLGLSAQRACIAFGHPLVALSANLQRLPAAAKPIIVVAGGMGHILRFAMAAGRKTHPIPECEITALGNGISKERGQVVRFQIVKQIFGAVDF